jgi:hypothetical protein
VKTTGTIYGGAETALTAELPDGATAYSFKSPNWHLWVKEGAAGNVGFDAFIADPSKEPDPLVVASPAPLSPPQLAKTMTAPTVTSTNFRM